MRNRTPESEFHGMNVIFYSGTNVQHLRIVAHASKAQTSTIKATLRSAFSSALPNATAFQRTTPQVCFRADLKFDTLELGFVEDNR